MNRPLTNRDIGVPQTWDRSGLPGWTYHSKAFLDLEKKHVLRNHWQIACHVSDVPEPGSYRTFDVLGERALIVRGKDDVVRAFHNICRHRGSRIVADDAGRCRGALVCPFHGWVYDFDGTLRGAARPDTFPEMDRQDFGLAPVETEIWNGFVFVRFEKGPQPSVAEVFAPFAAEMAHWRMDDVVPTRGVWSETNHVNWKSVRDVDNEGYHVALAHPALQDLYGRSYYDEPFVNGVCRSFASCNERGKRWSVRHYLKIMQPRDHLPDGMKRAWLYWGLFPNTVIAATPETVQFYQEFPLSTGETLLRGSVYRYRDENRAQRLARYLTLRIDRETMDEDVQLSQWSNEAMLSPAFSGFFLSDLEYGVRTHHDHIRALLPVATLDEAPSEDAMALVNAGMATC